MKSKSLIILVSVLILALIPLNYIFLGDPQIEEAPDFFVGVDVAYADLEAIKRVIDEVSSYTNLFVIGSTGISSDKIKIQVKSVKPSEAEDIKDIKPPVPIKAGHTVLFLYSSVIRSS